MHRKFLWLVLLIPFTGFGQDNNSTTAPEYKKSHYIHFSYGLGGDKNAVQFRSAFQITKKISIGAGIISTFANQTILSADPNSHTVDTYSVDVGYIHKARHALFRLSAAPTVNNISVYGPNSGIFVGPAEIKKGVFGIMLAGEVAVCGKVGGASLSSFVNINNEFTYGGLTFGFILGRLIVPKK